MEHREMWVLQMWRHQVHACSGTHRLDNTAMASLCCTRFYTDSGTITSTTGPPILQSHRLSLRALSRSMTTSSGCVHIPVEVVVRGAIHIWCTPYPRVSTWWKLLHEGSAVERIDLLCFLTRCRKRRLNQAVSVLSLSTGFLSMFCAVYSYFLCSFSLCLYVFCFFVLPGCVVSTWQMIG